MANGGVLNYDFFIGILKGGITVGIFFLARHRTRRIYHPYYIHIPWVHVPLDIYPNTYTAVDAVAYRRQCGRLRVGWRSLSIRYRAPGQMERENKMHVHTWVQNTLSQPFFTVPFCPNVCSESRSSSITLYICAWSTLQCIIYHVGRLLCIVLWLYIRISCFDEPDPWCSASIVRNIIL